MQNNLSCQKKQLSSNVYLCVLSCSSLSPKTSGMVRVHMIIQSHVACTYDHRFACTDEPLSTGGCSSTKAALSSKFQVEIHTSFSSEKLARTQCAKEEVCHSLEWASTHMQSAFH